MADKELKSITFPGLPDRYVIDGTDDYADLEHKPQINGVTLSGNKTTSELSLGSYSKPSGGIPKTDLAAAVQTSLGKADTALQSVNAGGVAFDDSATYQDGTVGKELSDQKNAINQLDDVVNDPVHGLAQKAPLIVNTASGDIASFPDGADSMPIKSLVASIEPVQDLHGYDNPWPGGGGNNKLPFPFADSSGVYNGVTFSVASDSKITASGTTTGGTSFFLVRNHVIKAGSYVISLTNSPVGMNLVVYDPINRAVLTSVSSQGMSGRFTVSEDTTVNIYFNTGTTGVEVSISAYVWLEIGTNHTAWSPYANICPISGHTGMTVTRTGKNLFSASEFVENNPDDYSLASDGSIEIQINREKKVLWENSKGYTGQIAITFIAKYQNTGAVGTRPVVIYTDGTRGTIYPTNTQTYSSTVFLSASGKTVAKIETDYGTSGNPTNFYLQVEFGSTASAYEPYTGTTIPITWQTEAGTVYVGTLDVISGKLIATHKMYELDGTETGWTKHSTQTIYNSNLLRDVLSTGQNVNGICSHISSTGGVIDSNYLAHLNAGSGAEFRKLIDYWGLPDNEVSTWTAYLAQQKTNGTPVQILGLLKTPIEYTITPVELTTLYGTNNIWIDTGSITECAYPADTKLYIDNKIATAIANTLNA